MENTKTCERCGANAEKVAYIDVDEWHLFWECSSGCGCLEDDDEIEWPFSRDYVTVDEMKAAGFRVEW